MSRIWLACLWFSFLLPFGLAAKPLSPQNVPEPLKPWIGWALFGNEQKACPFLYDNPEEHRCAWPSRLELSLGEKAGSFTANWQVDVESWAELPGDESLWPQAVEVDGKPAVVVSRAGNPSIWLPAGSHRLTGRLAWDSLPESLTIPQDSGLIFLTIKGKAVKPAFNDQGELWLQGAQDQPGEEVANTLEVRVYRRIIDEIPLRVVTQLDLEAAGEQREVLLSGGVLPKAIPLSLDSPVPARLENDGRLRVLVRPGHWRIELTTRQPQEANELQWPDKTDESWPKEEVWSFESHPQIRVVEIEGAKAVDPRQTEMPEEWKSLPAYRLQPGEKLVFKTLRRGDPVSAPDNLNLRRRLWLDFDGGGYTVHDEMAGTISRNWRLEALPDTLPGRVDVDGQPQLITLMEGAANAGVELRRGQVSLAADSRGSGALGHLSATGWSRDFQSVGAEVNLPPGWRLLAASGVDNAPDTWVGRWDLLDFFLVLIAALATARLRGWMAGALAAVALILLWHEPNAPKIVWLHLLAAVVLLQVLPEGRFRSLAKYYRTISLLALVFIALPFMVEQVRYGIYPQLERPGGWETRGRGGMGGLLDMESTMSNLPAAAPPAKPMMAPSTLPEPEQDYAKRALKSLSPTDKEGAKQNEGGGEAARIMEIDPNALTQTGPGLPNWRWKTINLSWNGPVLASQEMGLVLIPPGVNLVLNLLRASLILVLAWVLLKGGKWKGAMPGLQSLSLILLGLMFIPLAKAEMPSPQLLEELKARLLSPRECADECAQISLLRLKTAADGLSQRLEIHVQAATAVPLPVKEGQWLPTQASVDGGPAETLFRNDGVLWLGLKPGRHEVVLAGPLPSREQVQLPLPLKPHRVEVEGGGWRVEGIKENGEPDEQLQLTRLLESGQAKAEPELEARPLPPFLEVRRTLHFGINWRVSTQVVRISPADAPVLLEIPLLAGESATTPGLEVKNGQITVSLSPGQSEMGWESTLEQKHTVILKAPSTTVWSEVWLADASPVWHLESEGITVVRHQDAQGNRLPEWRPWPGESVSLQLVRPRGAKGPTLTLESSRLRLTPGLRATDASLDMALRSSQGGQHKVQLPKGAVLQTASIDGAPRPIRQQGREVALPIRPGSQNLQLSWRQETGILPFFASPEVDLGIPGVNSAISIEPGHDRWVLLAGGPRLGPAVLFWGLVGVLAMVALGLGRLDLTPLKARHWFLLLIGLSQVELLAGACVVGWLFALGWRGKKGIGLDDSRFNVIQLGLALLTPLALLCLFYAVQHGLLGLPDMQVAGNGSNAWMLNWYQDRSGPLLPNPWMLSAPIWSYRALMLLWALWLAYSLLDWLRWGFGCFATGGLWRPRKPPTQPIPPQTRPAGWKDEKTE